MHSPTDITLRRVLVGHRAAVNVVDFDTRYIVSASGDRTIKVWCTSTCEFVRTLNGHKRGIACLQYRDKLVVSGSSDNTIRSLTTVSVTVDILLNRLRAHFAAVLTQIYITRMTLCRMHTSARAADAAENVTIIRMTGNTHPMLSMSVSPPKSSEAK